jgi:hypothetical protein
LSQNPIIGFLHLSWIAAALQIHDSGGSRLAHGISLCIWPYERELLSGQSGRLPDSGPTHRHESCWGSGRERPGQHSAGARRATKLRDNRPHGEKSRCRVRHSPGVLHLCPRVKPLSRNQSIRTCRADDSRRLFQRTDYVHGADARWLSLARHGIRLTPLRAGHYGVQGMHERAGRIGGKLDLWTRTGAGTEIELSIPGSVAYGRSPGRTVFGLFRRKAANS